MQTVFEDGNLIIRAEKNGEQGLVCDLGALVSWQALLGTASHAETCAAMMQAHETAASYDPETGRNAYTAAYEGIEAALNDSASSVSMLSEDGEIQNDPMTAARNRTRAQLGLPQISNKQDSAVQAMVLDGETTENAMVGPTGIDTGMIDVTALDAALNSAQVQEKLTAAEERFYESLMPRPNTKED